MIFVPTKTATVLFTDIVDSVETAGRIGPAAAERLRRRHDDLVVGAIARHRGTVVKRLGDGMMAVFDAASHAVEAGVAIQQSIHRYNDGAGDESIAVRVGISGGDVTLADRDCFGIPVAEAARLCEAAQGGQVLASELVRVTSRGLSGAAFRSIGTLDLKGFPGGVDVVEVSWEPLRESWAPLPERLVPEGVFVGRRDERAELDRLFDQALAGEGRQLALVHAEPGMGKTALVRQAASSWHEKGAAVALGECDSELSIPYGPVSMALEHLVCHAPQQLLTSVVERHDGALSKLVPAIARRTSVAGRSKSTDPEIERYLGLAAAVDLLSSLAADRGLVLVFEDLHWADSASLTFLRHLVVNAGEARLLVVATFRDTEVTDGNPLAETLAVLRRHEGIARISVSGLGVSDVRELVSLLVDDRVGADATESIARQLVSETSGNAFYVRELIEHLAETGRLATADPADRLWSADGFPDLPESVVEVVASRVARLGRSAIDLLTLAAAIGTQFDIEVLRAASGRSDEELLSLMGAAGSSHIVSEVPGAVGRYAFAHALVAHSLLRQAGSTRRAMLHQKVAVALEGLSQGQPSVALAYHWGETGYTANASRARDYARQAADEAVEALAPGDAARWYERALKLDDLSRATDVADRVDLLTKLGVAQRQAGDGGYRHTLIEAAQLARDIHDPGRLARAMIESNRGMFTDFGKVDWEKVELLEAAIGTADSADVRTRSELLAILANELTYNNDYPARRSYADEAIALARGLGEPSHLFRVMNLIFHAIWNPETLDERVAMSAESRDLADQVGDPGIRFWAAHRHYLNLLQSGQIDQADRCLDEQYEIAEGLEQPLYRWVDRFSQAARLLLSGDYMEAERAALEALRYGEESDQPEAATFFRLNMMTVFWQSGRQFDIQLGEEMAAGLPGAQSVRGGLALLAADSGSLRHAARILDDAVGKRFADMHPDPGYLTGLVSYAEAAILLRDRAAAEILHGLLEPRASQVGFDGNTCVGPVVHYVAALAALLGRQDQAVAQFEDSLAECRRLRAPFFEARGMVEWARVLIESNESADWPMAAKLLEEALGIAEAKGYAAVARRARDLLASGR